MRLLRIALVGLTLLIGPVPASAQLTDLLPEDPYGTALGTALQTGEFDFAALRAAYAADPAYTGRSRLRDHDPASSPKWTEDDVLRAIFADFPLLDTHMAAPTRPSTMGRANGSRDTRRWNRASPSSTSSIPRAA